MPSGRVPGTLIKHEPLPAALSPTQAGAAYRLFYQGTGYDGRPKLITGSAFVPHGYAPADGWPVVAFAHGTTGLHQRAVPSRTGLSRPELAHVDGWLAAGYAVAATDYEGRGVHPYFNGEATADDVIDAVRAAHALDRPLDKRWIVAGFSQGGHAAHYTAITATAYAPELDFRGSVSFGPAVGLRAMVAALTADGHAPVPWVIPMFLAGLPQLHAEVFLTVDGVRLLRLAERATLKEMAYACADVTNDAAGTTGLAGHPELTELLDRIDVPVTTLDRPALVHAGVRDVIAPISIMEPFVHALREAGGDVGLVRCAGADHVGVLEDGLPHALEFAARVLEVPPRPTEGCRFSLLDATGDGYLSRDDYTAFALRLVLALGEAPRSPRAHAVREGYLRLWRAIVTRADTDGDGRVSRDEYAAWAARSDADGAFDAAVRPLAWAVIGLADTDEDGLLNRPDLTRLLTACNLTKEQVGRTIAELDTDGSGTVSADEIVTAVRDFCRGRSTAGEWLFGRV
ncbi:lipase family protein [Hamadaea tsunoensis]|uniref:lipase family protein n=1 Tax=Hamadaea tsunoensis TaxID=53368 RepID=UPI000A04C8E0|nr:lipase family protein [Hamadaea tsunoensis]